jgi:D-serine deaminase-like pyridoxal phosphate-dependent protein
MKIIKPTLLLIETQVKENITRMVEKAIESNVRFRPHFKTHQSITIGKWFKEKGVKSITVSSVDMAKYFAENGWDDISIAFTTNILQIEQINELAEKIDLHLLVESVETIEKLNQKIEHEVNIWLKIDTDYHRTGINWQNFSKIKKEITSIQKNEKLNFKGLLTHSGHAYYAKTKEEIITIYTETVERLNDIKQRLLAEHFPELELSIGDTPTCSIMDHFEKVDEIRPGNFVFYDIMQLMIGSCEEREIAVGLACPVVAKHPERNEIIIYGGAIHLSKESFKHPELGKIYGLVTKKIATGWDKPLSETYVSSLSQEHGEIKTTPEILKTIDVGEVLVILPIHSCLTANLMGEYYTIKGTKITTNPY